MNAQQVEAISRHRPWPNTERLLDGNDTSALECIIRCLQIMHFSEPDASNPTGLWLHLSEELGLNSLDDVDAVEEWEYLMQVGQHSALDHSFIRKFGLDHSCRGQSSTPFWCCVICLVMGRFLAEPAINA